MIYLSISPLQWSNVVLNHRLLLVRGGRVLSDHLQISAVTFLVLSLELYVCIVKFLLRRLAVLRDAVGRQGV